MEILKERTIVKILSLTCLVLLSGCDTKRDSVGGSDDLIVLAAKEDRDKVRSLLSTVFNEKGKHTRAAVSVSSLPLGAAVEVDGIFEL